MSNKTTVISEAQLNAQFAFCDRIADLWRIEGRTPTAYVETYGCQQNGKEKGKQLLPDHTFCDLGHPLSSDHNRTSPS